jgi:peptidoglycan L-alanyl-D-glutamate endopeptidase CwlK
VDPSQVTSRSLDDLDPSVKLHALAVIARMEARGFPVYVSETYRSAERQAWLAEHGRSRVSKDGAHGQRRALDLVDARMVAGVMVLWGASDPSWGLSAEQVAARKAAAAEFFRALGEEARAEGFTWGGGWTSLYDPAHLEWPSGAVGKAVGVVDAHPVTVALLGTLALLVLVILAIAALPRKPHGPK